jgi:RimJ/RimL family protein N-acetyltransferase
MEPRRRSGRDVALRLRAANPSDAHLLWRWRTEESVRRHQPLAAVSTDQIRSDLAQQQSADLATERGEKFQWIILVDELPAGWITMVVTNWQHGLAEIGYAFSSRHQGRGRMGPALELLLAEVFLGSTIERIEARCTVDNVASQRVLEGLGFEREGRLRGYFVLHGERTDNYLYALLRSDWTERQGL